MGNYLLFGNWVIQQISKLGLLIDAIVYTFTAKAYEVFLLVSEAQLFDDGSELLSEITSRIYSILGIVMLFVLAYNIIKLILNPDKLSSSDDSSLQGIAKNLVISIIILVLLPTAFKYIYQFQNRVLETNVLSRMILGGTSSSDGEFSIKSAGRDVAITILSTFLHPVNNENTIFTANECQNPGIENKPAICDEYVEVMENSIDNGKIFQFATNKTITNAIGSDMEYLWPASLAAGVIALYLFLSFALDLGVRVVKLGVLQIIAPIPVISRVTKPKGGVFDKWFKEISKTYLMVFERLIVIYFAVFMLRIICNDNLFFVANLTKTSASGGLVLLLAKVILILGTLKFAKDAPKLIEDLVGTKLPDWRIKNKLNENEYAKRTASALGAAGVNTLGLFKSKSIGKGLINAPRAIFGGLKHGWDNGNVSSLGEVGSAIWKSHEQTNEDIARADDTRAKGLTIGGRHIPGLSYITGYAMGIPNRVINTVGNIYNKAGNQEFSDTLTAVTSSTKELVEAIKNPNSKGLDNIDKYYDEIKKQIFEKGVERRMEIQNDITQAQNLLSEATDEADRDYLTKQIEDSQKELINHQASVMASLKANEDSRKNAKQEQFADNYSNADNRAKNAEILKKLSPAITENVDKLTSAQKEVLIGKLQASFEQFGEDVSSLEGYLSKIQSKLKMPATSPNAKFTAAELAGFDILTSYMKSLETDIKSHHAADKAKKNSDKK